MNRRDALRVLLALGATPLAAHAQPAGKAYRVGFILTTSPLSEMAGPEPVHPLVRAFLHGLRALGYVEGQNLILERRSAEGRFERFGDIVAELVGLKTDVIVTATDPMTRAAKAVTTTVPIVMFTPSLDPVAAGLVQSLARPGGNVTGVTGSAGPEIQAKRLELLREALPGISRVAYFASKPDNEWESVYGKTVRAAANALGLTLLQAEYLPQAYSDAFALIRRLRADALYVGPTGPAYALRAQIVDFTTQARLPGTFPYREAVELGALMSYGPNVPDAYRRVAMYVDKILKGAKPADLPVQQPTNFELVINLKTARALGLTIPRSILSVADDVIG